MKISTFYSLLFVFEQSVSNQISFYYYEIEIFLIKWVSEYVFLYSKTLIHKVVSRQYKDIKDIKI